MPLAAFLADHIAYLFGYPDGDVRPDNDITRAEASALIHRLLSDPKKNDSFNNPFEFADSEWYKQSVTYLAQAKMVIGYDDGTFKPEMPITRAEFITIVSRFEKDFGPLDVSFSDIDGHWAEEFINIGASKGWISGYPDGSFRPDNNITRAEVVSLINRLLYRGIELEDIPSWGASFTDIDSSYWAYSDIVEAATGHDFDRKPSGYEIWTGRHAH